MRRRYIVKPRMASLDDGLDAENYLARTVFEPDPAPVRTGLLDARGNELFAVVEIGPIGFVRFDRNV